MSYISLHDIRYASYLYHIQIQHSRVQNGDVSEFKYSFCLR